MSRSLAGVALALALLGAAPSAFAQADARAREAFNRGVELYEQARYPEALVSFRAAFELRPHPSVRVNIANCLARLGQAVEGTYHFRRFLQERGEEISADQRAGVQREIDGMRMDVAEVEVRVEPPDAEVFIDGVHPETRIGSSIFLSPGRHVVEGRKSGRASAREEVDLVGGSRRQVVLVLTAEGAPVPVPPPPLGGEPQPQPEPAPEPDPVAGPEPQPEPEPGPAVGAEVDSTNLERALPWIGAGATAVSLGIAIAFSALALTAENEVELNVGFWEDDTDPEHRAVYEHNAREWADAADTRALVADVFYVLTLALGAGTAYLFFFADDGGADGASDVAVSPIFAPGAAGLVLAGSLPDL